jgi:hypothetical protein
MPASSEIDLDQSSVGSIAGIMKRCREPPRCAKSGREQLQQTLIPVATVREFITLLGVLPVMPAGKIILAVKSEFAASPNTAAKLIADTLLAAVSRRFGP